MNQDKNIYNPIQLEKKLRQQWEQNNVYKVHASIENNTSSNKPKYYACSMLPYPSGKLHMGHVRNYTINDVMTRQLRMQGYNVLMPMGWDAFGMPAENAAINNNIAPAAWTYQNIADMKEQISTLGFAIDWSKEIATCDPSYYKWNQWLFLRMREKGIAYRKNGTVNWDPVDQTVLANEQVIDGKGWRSGAIIEKREIPMWYLNITKYSQELIDDLAYVNWPERVKTMQHNWIGKSTGVRLAFTHDIKDADNNLIQDGKMWAFTTRADTLMGVTFCAVSYEHPLAKHAANNATNKNEIANFIAECELGSVMEADMANMPKKGIFTGLYVAHPISGEQIPVWIGNYVLMSYGDGAVMGVPAHDERDFEFANTYNIDIKQVIKTTDNIIFNDKVWHESYASKQSTCINSDILDDLNFAQAVDKVADILANKTLGNKQDTFRLRDWGISRQRYWGTPIPIIHCPDCGEVPVPDKDLPVILPQNLVPDGGGNILARTPEFLNVTCPKCGNIHAKRETDTMDTFVDSCWYYMRYTCPDNAEAMVDARNDYWMPMDMYIGGIEHAILHLLYARFWTKVMRDMGLVNFSEPFTKLLTQGMVLNDSFYRIDESSGGNGKKTWYYPHEVELQLDEKARPVSAVLKSDGLRVEMGGIEKMSKSKNNVIEPKTLVDNYGADTARLFTMFAASPEQSLEWNNDAVEGCSRYLRRLWNYCIEYKKNIGKNNNANINISIDKKYRFELHKLLKQTSYDYERIQYNTVVSACMKILNTLEEAKKNQASLALITEGITILLCVLYPIVPHICCELWSELGLENTHGSLMDYSWPQVDESALVQDEISMTLQISGKTKAQINIPAGSSSEQIENIALTNEIVIKTMQSLNIHDKKDVKKIIIVPNRLINIVL
jgi:leucyl-tRNA synthetase